MFKIDFMVFICYYLIGGLFLVLLLWLWYNPVNQKGRRSVDPQRIWQCSTCFYVYFEPRLSAISTCPLCSSINQRHEFLPAIGQVEKGGKT